MLVFDNPREVLHISIWVPNFVPLQQARELHFSTCQSLGLSSEKEKEQNLKRKSGTSSLQTSSTLLSTLGRGGRCVWGALFTPKDFAGQHTAVTENQYITSYQPCEADLGKEDKPS